MNAFNSFTKLFKEDNGKFSSIRLPFLVACFLVLGMWGVVSIKTEKLVEIPDSVTLFVGSLGIMKVAQKFAEEDISTPADEPDDQI